MQKRDRAIILTLIMIILVILAGIAMSAAKVEAKTHSSNQYGLFKSGGSWYYLFFDKSSEKDDGEQKKVCNTILMVK